MIKSAIFLKQQLKYEENRSRQHSKGGASVGGRLIFGKLDSTIDYGVAIRETSSSSSAMANIRSRSTGPGEKDIATNK